MKKRKIIPYNSKLVPLAKKLRQATPAIGAKTVPPVGGVFPGFKTRHLPEMVSYEKSTCAHR
jgi:hypothetical protein